jgi:hypothetical protein
MNELHYVNYLPEAALSTFTFDGDNAPFMVCAAHAYLQPDGTYRPKLEPGIYTCVLGEHSLHDGVKFMTYEITGVDGHTGILFHPGNYAWSQSDGCNLVGEKFADAPGGAVIDDMVTNSVATFKRWMAYLHSTPSFRLLVTDDSPL